jgi:hypothetical protein
MRPSTVKNLSLSLLLSLVLTVIAAFLYIFYPLLDAFVAMAFSDPHTDDVFAVAGGMSGWLLTPLLMASALFIVIFLLLQKRSAKG